LRLWGSIAIMKTGSSAHANSTPDHVRDHRYEMT
jgi:hypothetical protein